MTDLVYLKNERAVTTSLKIAETFHKSHAHVLRDIQSLDCSAEFAESNFGLSNYTDSTGRKLPMYYVTKDGFSFLVMGYRGKKAAQFKEAYIKRFNVMESYIKSHAIEISQRRTMTDAIRDSGENERMNGFGYSQYTDLIYRIATGKSAKQLREEYGITKKDSIKEHLTPEQVEMVGNLEIMVSGMVALGLIYPAIKGALNGFGIGKINDTRCDR